jgi:FkbM family methyltransferase
VGNLVLSLAGFAARVLPVEVKKAFYRYPRLARFIRLGLNRSAPEGLTRVKVAGGALAGTELLLDLQSEKDYWLGTYEADLQAALWDFTRPGMVAYDAGANIGYISLLFARRVGPRGRVFAFEALPGNLGRLETNIRLNDWAGRITIVPQALADGVGLRRFLVGPSGGMGKLEGSAGRQQVDYPASIEVQGTSLDDFIYGAGNPAPDVVKMDIEGGEVLALAGMRRTLELARPAVFLELHGPQAAQAAWETLSGSGYRLHRITPGNPVVSSFKTLGWKSYLAALPDRQAGPVA